MDMADPDQASYSFNQCTAKHQSPLLSNMKTYALFSSLKARRDPPQDPTTPAPSHPAFVIVGTLRHNKRLSRFNNPIHVPLGLPIYAQRAEVKTSLAEGEGS